MRPVQPDFAVVVIMLIDDGDLVRLLQELDVEIPEDIGHRIDQALVVGVRKSPSRYRDFTVFLEHLRGLRLQNRMV